MQTEIIEELMNIIQEVDILSYKISSRVAQLNADVFTTRSDPVITDLWHSLCKHHRKAMVLCSGMGSVKPDLCKRVEKPQVCIDALHLSEEETCCAVFRRNLQAKTKEKRKVKYIMSSPVITIDPNSRIAYALGIMRKHGIGSLVVVDRGKIKGIMTRKDLISKVFAGATSPDELAVSDIMTPSPLVTVDPENDIQKVAEIMVKKSVGHLPVIERDKLVGMMAISDFYGEEMV